MQPVLWDAAVAKARNMLRRRGLSLSRHYKRLFTPDDGMSRDAEIVLADLRDYCFGQKTGFSSDPQMAARNAGRREVWLRIVNSLGLDENQVLVSMEVEDE